MTRAPNRHETVYTAISLYKAGFTAQEIIELQKLALSYARIMETKCGRELDGKEQRREGWLAENITNMIIARNRRIDTDMVTLEFCGDPRGYCVRLYLPSGDSNSFANNHWGLA